MTVDSGMRLGSGIWTMIPATWASALSRSISSRTAAADAAPGHLHEPTLDADLRARLEDLVEVDGRRRVAPDDERPRASGA